MTIWKHSQMETYFADQTVSNKWPCEVRIGNGKIVVSYESDGFVTYEGVDDGTGHFELKNSNNVRDRATLHLTVEKDRLEGSWIEEGQEGMWRIDLEE